MRSEGRERYEHSIYGCCRGVVFVCIVMRHVDWGTVTVMRLSMIKTIHSKVAEAIEMCISHRQ